MAREAYTQISRIFYVVPEGALPKPGAESFGPTPDPATSGRRDGPALNES